MLLTPRVGSWNGNALCLKEVSVPKEAKCQTAAAARKQELPSPLDPLHLARRLDPFHSDVNLTRVSLLFLLQTGFL